MYQTFIFLSKIITIYLFNHNSSGVLFGVLLRKKFKLVRSQLGEKNGYISWKYTYETTLKNLHMSRCPVSILYIPNKIWFWKGRSGTENHEIYYFINYRYDFWIFMIELYDFEILSRFDCFDSQFWLCTLFPYVWYKFYSRFGHLTVTFLRNEYVTVEGAKIGSRIWKSEMGSTQQTSNNVW